MQTNNFSSKWFNTFAEAIPSEQTEIEIAFVRRNLPLESFPRLLDLCCGTGRHARPLVDFGYRVTGVDSSSEAIRIARQRVPEARFIQKDLRAIAELDDEFDGCINLWHSFGYFDDSTNQRILADIHERLRPGGRLIIDVYNRDHFKNLPVEEIRNCNGETLRTSRAWEGPRLKVLLEYGSGGFDEFEWHIYTPSEFRLIACDSGFREVLSCAWFDETIAVSEKHARMQFVLEKP